MILILIFIKANPTDMIVFHVKSAFKTLNKKKTYINSVIMQEKRYFAQRMSFSWPKAAGAELLTSSGVAVLKLSLTSDPSAWSYF